MEPFCVLVWLFLCLVERCFTLKLQKMFCGLLFETQLIRRRGRPHQQFRLGLQS